MGHESTFQKMKNPRKINSGVFICAKMFLTKLLTYTKLDKIRTLTKNGGIV